MKKELIFINKGKREKKEPYLLRYGIRVGFSG